jgi:23S rRNA pseudouridine1911/1915/1917 synthase
MTDKLLSDQPAQPKSNVTKIKLVSNDSDQPVRLDIYLNSLFTSLSRSYLAKLIAQGQIKVNHQLSKPAYRLKKSDKISYNEAAIMPSKPAADFKLPIIYEDDFCLVIFKPSGIISHGKNLRPGFQEGSVASFIRSKLADGFSGDRAGIVHRLDRGTSGIMIAAKTFEAQTYLQRQFAKRQVHKTYLAIVCGTMEQQEALINLPIERNPKTPSTFRVGVNGKPAQTEYQVIGFNQRYSGLKLMPITGRTHQLRVHLKALKHPIVGDTLYGGIEAPRLMLHAYSLSVILPDIGRVEFKADNNYIPNEFNDYLKLNWDSSTQ